MPDYDAHIEHLARCHPEHPLPTRRQFYEVVKAIQSNPVNEDVVAFTGFDLLGGGFRNNAATIFVTLIMVAILTTLTLTVAGFVYAMLRP